MIDPNEAPEGYIAVEQPSGDCTGCAFGIQPYPCLKVMDASCIAETRKDRTVVIFKKKEPDA